MSEYCPLRPVHSSTRPFSMTTCCYRSDRAASLGLAVAVVLIPAYLLGADHSHRTAGTTPLRHAETVEMFRAIEDGKIYVKLIPKNSKQSNVLIENKTGKPLSVGLPGAFAGAPVLAQFDDGGFDGGTSSSGSGGTQALGGGFGGGGISGGGIGGGFFSIPPESVRRLKVTTVCLEHGKPEPRPAVKYEIKPIDEFTDEGEIHAICRMLGSGLLDQRSAQAAAWHLSSNMSWQQLAAKQLRFANGTTRPYFDGVEIRRAMQAVSMASQLAEQRRKTGPGGSLSQQ